MSFSPRSEVPAALIGPADRGCCKNEPAESPHDTSGLIPTKDAKQTHKMEAPSLGISRKETVICKVVQVVKAPITKPGDLNSIP